MLVRIIAPLSLVLVVLFVGCEPEPTLKELNDQLKLHAENPNGEAAVAIQATKTALLEKLWDEQRAKADKRRVESDKATAMAVANAPKLTLTAGDAIIVARGYAETEQQINCTLVFESWTAVSDLRNRDFDSHAWWWKVKANVDLIESGFSAIGTLKATWSVDDKTMTVFPATFIYEDAEGSRPVAWPCGRYIRK